MLCVRKLFTVSAAVLASLGVVILSGCGIGGVVSGGEDKAADTVTLTGAHIRGRVHGGAFPIQNANIQLWQTGTGSWNTTTHSYAPSFLNSTSSNPNFIAGTTSASAGDGSGLAPGYFDFGSATLTCTPGNYLYLTQTGGGTVPGNANSSVIQIGVIGVCPSNQSPTAFLNQVNVYMSELSTVAAAYTLGNFISVDTDPTTGLQRVNITAPANNTATGACTGTGTAMTCTAAGLAHGFGNAINLVDSVRTNGTSPSGTANASLPPSYTAIVPQAMLGTLGNILQSCVDSGPSTPTAPSSTCKTLFNATPLNSSGVKATNSLQAAVNISRNPNTNVNTLFGLQTPNTFFSPYLSQAPNDYTISIYYPATAVGDSLFSNAVDVALDAQDNVYVAYTRVGGSGAVAALTANGTQLFAGSQPGLAGTILKPATLAVDPSGYVWVSDSSNNLRNSPTVLSGNVYGFSTSVNATGAGIGAYYNAYTVPYGNASGIAFNNKGDAFITRKSTDANIDAFYYKAGSFTYKQAGTTTGTAFYRAQVDSYGTFYAVGDSTFLSMAPVPSTNTGTGAACPSAGSYAESTVALDAAGGSALAIDNRSGNYNAFLPIKNKLSTANVTIKAGQPVQCWTATASANNYVGSVATTSINSDAAVMDGSGNLYWNTVGAKLFFLPSAEAGEGTSGGTLTGTVSTFQPCFLASQSTACQPPANMSGLVVDSSGTMWFGATDSNGNSYLVQTFGLAQPTWPLLAYAKSGMPF